MNRPAGTLLAPLLLTMACSTPPSSVPPIPPTASSSGGVPDDFFFIVGEVSVQEAWAGLPVFPQVGVLSYTAHVLDDEGVVPFRSFPGFFRFDGQFDIFVNSPALDRVLISILSSRHLPIHRVIPVQPNGTAQVDETMAFAGVSRGLGGRCTVDFGRVLVEEQAGQQCLTPARVLDPVDDATLLPMPLVLGERVLRPVSAVATGAVHSVTWVLPRRAWSRLPPPSGSTWELPVYRFDSTRVAWVPHGRAAQVLQGDGQPMPPERFAAIADGSHPGVVVLKVLADDVPEATTLVVAQPAEGRICMCSRIRTEVGVVPTSARVTLLDAFPWGPPPVTWTVEDGRFCMDALGSEPVDMDLDGDGIPAEVRQARFVVFMQTPLESSLVRTEPLDLPVWTGGECMDFAEVRAGGGPQYTPRVETIRGQVTLGGAAVASGVRVMGVDPTLGARAADICAGLCRSTVTVGGAFEVTVPVRSHVTLSAELEVQDGMRERTRYHATAIWKPGDPPVALELEPVQVEAPLQVRVEDGRVTWSPPLPLRGLQLLDSAQHVRWTLTSTTQDVRPPIVLDNVPEGATASGTFPSTQLRPGSRMVVSAGGMGTDGTVLLGDGVYYVQ